MKKSVRSRLPELLKMKGWSQQDLAIQINSSRQQVNDWCRTRSIMLWTNACVVSRVLGIEMDELYEWIDQPND